jgi:hypothetical protein
MLFFAAKVVERNLRVQKIKETKFEAPFVGQKVHTM